MRSSIPIAASLLLAGCSHHVYSPPARALPMESVAPVGEGRVGVAGEGATQGAVFGPGLTSGAGRVRVSPHRDVDISVEGTVMHVRGNGKEHVDQNIYSARVGGKYQVLARYIAIVGGLGGGYHAAGTFVSPDLGAIVGYENDYAVPFASVRGFVSAPLVSRSVDTAERGEDSRTGSPQLTGGFTTSLGLRIPIPPSFDQSEGVRGSLVVSPGLTYLGDGDEEATFLQLGGGAEVTF